MKTKLVLWGSNAQDERVLIALQLRAKENKVDIFTFPESVATDEFAELMMNAWREDQEITFPEGHQQQTRELSMTEGLLPDDLKVERTDIVNRAQTEWHFIVLSSKLHQAYQTELEELKERVDQLGKFDHQVWDSLKEFWAKVQDQVRDRNLFREHSNNLRDRTNELFAKLKVLRSKMDEEFASKSKESVEKFMKSLEEVEGRITEGLRLQQVFEDLKSMQKRFRDTKFTREHRSKVWERLDAAFKAVKEKRFGPDANTDSSPLARLTRRYDGLLVAIDKMERSIQRDRKDLSFQERKIASSEGQLEAQIRQAKIKMINERVRSKEEKLGEMMQTKAELERRLADLKAKADKKAAEQAAKDKIAQQIKEQQQEEPKKEEKAKKEEKPKNEEPKEEKEPSEPLGDKIRESLGDSLEDMVDTIKAVTEVVSDRIEDKVDKLKNKEKGEAAKDDEKEEEPMMAPISKTVNESLDEVIEDVKEVAEAVNEKIEEKVEEIKKKIKDKMSDEEE